MIIRMKCDTKVCNSLVTNSKWVIKIIFDPTFTFFWFTFVETQWHQTRCLNEHVQGKMMRKWNLVHQNLKKSTLAWFTRVY